MRLQWIKWIVIISLQFLFVKVGNSQVQENQIVSVKGENIYKNTLLACEKLELGKAIKPGMRVGILVNSDFEVKGAYVNPDITLAVIKICVDAGANEVVALQNIKPEYWERSSLFAQHSEALKKVRCVEANTFPSVFDSVNFVKLDTVPGALHLKNIEVVKEVFDVDFFINISIAKHHASTILTNAMKNMMGLGTRNFGVTFHLNGPQRNDPEFLATCIAELNLIRKPDFIVSDVTEVITTNGPNGPGELIKPMIIVAGKDVVAVDVYCAKVIGFDPEKIPTISKGFELGLGEKDLNGFKLLELQQ